MLKKSFSLRTSVVALASTVALAALMTAGAGTAFASTDADSVQSNLTSASVTAVGPYSINDAADMTALDTYVEGGGSTANVVFNLNASVTLGSTWDGIGSVASQNNSYGTSSVTSASESFDGIFHGNGNTITLSGGSQGVFAFLGIDARVDNFTVAQAEGATYGVTSGDSTDYIGAVAGFSRGKIEKVTNNAIVYANSAYNVGGIVGFNDGYNVDGQTYIKGCLNKAKVTGKQKVGGIAGENAASIILCENDGKIVGSNTSSKNGVGGIAGRNGNNNTARETGIIASCLNKGTIGSSSQKWVGGITGFQNSKSSNVGCLNLGTITAGAGYFNPIVGNNEGTTTNSYYYGTLNHSSDDADECGLSWGGSADTLNGARDTSIVADACWSGSNTSVALSLTATGSAPSNAAMGSAATAVTVYLDGSAGNDANAGTDSSAPVKTLERAAAVVSAGGNGSQILVSGAATVSSDVTIRQDITITWTGSDANATMFTVTAGKVTLGGSVKVVAGTGTSATAFDLTGGNLVVQDNASITAGKYAAKVANNQTMTISNSTISGTVYLYAGGLLSLPSELSSNISVECASLSTESIDIATCGSTSIVETNKNKISIANTEATLTTVGVKIQCSLTTGNTPSSVMSELSVNEASEATQNIIYQWHPAFTETPAYGTVPDGLTILHTAETPNWAGEVEEDWEDWSKEKCSIADLVDGTHKYGDNFTTSTSGKGYQWWVVDSYYQTGTYIMPSNMITLPENSKLSFEALASDGKYVSVFVTKNKNNLDAYKLVKTIQLGDGSAQNVATEPVVDLSAYTGDYYVVIAMRYLDNKSNTENPATYSFSNIKVYTEVASKDPAMTLTTDAKDLKVGDEVTVNVDMENITAAGQATFEYSDNLELQSITKGSALSGDKLVFYTGDEASKTVSPTFEFANNEGTTDGTVAVATFKCTKAGSASVSLTKAVGSKFGDPTELDIADAKLDAFTIGLNPAIKGDVNNSGKLNVVDAQVAYDMVNKVYADGTESRTKLINCWEPETTGATYELIEGVANVNGGDFDAQDAFAILVAAHNGGWTTA